MGKSFLMCVFLGLMAQRRVMGWWYSSQYNAQEEEDHVEEPEFSSECDITTWAAPETTFLPGVHTGDPSIYCCSSLPYNITSQRKSVVVDVGERKVRWRTVVRVHCRMRPFRGCEEIRTEIRTIPCEQTRQVYGTVISEVLCRPEDVICCEGYVADGLQCIDEEDMKEIADLRDQLSLTRTNEH